MDEVKRGALLSIEFEGVVDRLHEGQGRGGGGVDDRVSVGVSLLFFIIDLILIVIFQDRIRRTGKDSGAKLGTRTCPKS
jgi:hypothetical protein